MFRKPFKMPESHVVIHASLATFYAASGLGVDKALVAGAIAGCYALLALCHS